MSRRTPSGASPSGGGPAPGAAPTQAAFGPTRFCPSCYAANAWAAQTCVPCGAELETARGFDERLVWALDHPDGATAIRAAGVLAARHTREAVEPLGRLSRRRDDPYRAAAAARALRAFADEPRAAALLAEARRHSSVIVRRAAADVDGEYGPPAEFGRAARPRGGAQ
jgi:HEAT repeat protein